MIINLHNNSYATCSDDSDIKIWKTNSLFATISLNNIISNGIVYLPNNILVSANNDNTVVFYNIETLRPVHVINNVISNLGGIYLSNSNKLLIGFSESFTIINPITYQIETVMILSFLFGFRSIVEYSENTFLFARNLEICLLELNKGKAIHIYTLHNLTINTIISLGNNLYASGANDREIKIWKYNDNTTQ